jgi:trehalose/maltose transport system permease protein
MTRLAKAFGLYLLVVLIVGYTLFPFFWAVVSSLKSGSAIFDAALIPDQPTLQNYLAIFAEQPFGRTIVNSLIVGAGTVALSLLLAIGAAYALGRVSFRGRGLLLMVILAVSMFPQVAVLSGMFELITALGLYDSHGALILPTSSSPCRSPPGCSPPSCAICRGSWRRRRWSTAPDPSPSSPASSCR